MLRCCAFQLTVFGRPTSSQLKSTTRYNDVYTWADHLILALIFFREIIIRSEMATELDTWQLGRYHPTFALWRPLGERLQQCASHFTMEEKVQQRVCIHFCFRLGKTGAETYDVASSFRRVPPKSIEDI